MRDFRDILKVVAGTSSQSAATGDCHRHFTGSTVFRLWEICSLKRSEKRCARLTYYDHLTAYAVAENQIEKLGSPKLAILPSAQALTDKTWRALLKYVNDGGNLLITGPVERDEHWHQAHRIAELKISAEAQPLMYHSAAIKLKDRTIPLAFNQQVQSFMESLRFADGSNFKEIPYGKGLIFWAADPVELSESVQASADLYAYVAAQLGLAPAYEPVVPLPWECWLTPSCWMMPYFT